MTNWVALASQLGLLLVLMLILLGLTKGLRGKRGALSVGLNLDDLTVLSVVSLTLVTSQLLLPSWAMILLACGVGLYGFLVWLDALLFIQYRIEINRQTLAWFLTGTKGLSKGIPHLLDGLKKFPIAIVVPPAWIALVCWQAAGGLSNGLSSSAPKVLLTGVAVTTLATLVVLALLWVMRALFQSQHPFLTSPTLLLNILADDTFEVTPGVTIKSEHQRFVEPNPQVPAPSDQFGKVAGANIILITVESLGAYVTPYARDAAHSRLAERLQHQSWLSKQHFCLCPNTTVSTNQMYTGGYSNNPYNKADSLYPGSDPKHIELLKAHGYKTLFLDSADIKLYDYHKLLSRIGFDKVWGTDDLPDNGLKADYRLLNMVDEVAEQICGQNFYLHIINDQTHMPYEVVDKKRFNRHGFADAKSVYLNAMEEVDYILDTFLQRLSDKVDLSNTLLVFTGDHGESFGEYGYSFHSNSVIRPQMQVPFMLHHPKLGAKTMQHSCHFDLFPTFFDLLGIDCPYPTLGQSLVKDAREFAYFFHSATLKGNSPANFGFMLDGDMIWMDRLFNQVNVLQQGQQKVSLGAEQKRYSKTLLHHMLKSRGVLV